MQMFPGDFYDLPPGVVLHKYREQQGEQCEQDRLKCSVSRCVINFCQLQYRLLSKGGEKRRTGMQRLIG